MKHQVISKLISFFLIIVMVKFILLIISAGRAGVDEFLFSLLILFIFFAGTLIVVGFLKGGQSSSGSSAGSSVLLEETIFDKLRRKYETLAEQYRSEGNYLKASNIYLKLLKNPYRAAAILEEGGYYNEAAAFYLHKLSNKQSAAQCYEKGHNFRKAIELYTELGNKEKAGDLYLLMNDRSAAFKCYESLITDYTQYAQYVKASLVARYKMNDAERTRQLLLEGWNKNADSFNCINNYFASYSNFDVLKKAIRDVYVDTPESRKEIFLSALKYEFDKGKEMEEVTRDLAYEIIAGSVKNKPYIVSELKKFNPSDKLIVKDIIRYKAAGNTVIANR